MTEYNGWANHATWCVNLWLTNELGTADGLAAIVRNPTADARTLRGYVEDLPCIAEVLNKSTLASDLLSGYLDDVDWAEIIKAHSEDEAGQ